MSAGQLDLFAGTSEQQPLVPGHRYQRFIHTCQCRLRENDSITGMWGSVERVGVVARLAMTPEQHTEHLRTLGGAA